MMKKLVVLIGLCGLYAVLGGTPTYADDCQLQCVGDPGCICQCEEILAQTSNPWGGNNCWTGAEACGSAGGTWSMTYSSGVEGCPGFEVDAWSCTWGPGPDDFEWGYCWTNS